MRFTLAAFGILMLAGSPPALAQTPDPRVDECKTANPDRQLDVCQKVLASVPKPPNGALVVAHNGLCSAFRQKGDLDRAVAECSEALKIAPDNWTAFWTRGFAYQNKRDFDHAIADFTSAVKFGSTAPDFDPGVYYHRAESQAQKGRYEDTVADYSAYLRLRPNDVNARNARGFNNLRLGRADAAIEDFGAAIQTNPKWQVSFYNRGLAWIKKGDDAKALADLDEAIRIQPAYPAAHVERGNLYLPKGDAASAYGDFDAAVSVTPRYQAAIDGRDQALTRLKAAGKPVPNAPAISAAGAPSGPPASTTPPDPRLLETCQTGPPESRIEACGRLLVAVPPPPAAALAAAHDSLCESYRLKNVMDKSLDECQQAIALEPANWAHYWQRGVTYEEKGQSIPAIADFTAAEQRGADAPDFNPEVYYHRGSLYRDKGQFDEARQDYSAFIRLRPKNMNGYNQLGYVDLKQGKLDDAIDALNTAIAGAPKWSVPLYNRARVWIAKNESAKALADLNKAIELSPNYIFALNERGQFYLQAGDPARAIKDFDAVLALKADNAFASKNRADASKQLAAAGKPAPAPPPPPAIAASRPADAGATLTATMAALPGKAAVPGARVALVIGNSAYKFATPLPNPANDSTDIAKALTAVGFTVIEGHDLDWRGMVAKVREFSAQLDKADIALVFYAGHGVQVNGHNYLIPVDAKLDRAGDLDLDAVDLQTILRPMEAARRVNLVFLDACRDNPFTRSLARSSGAGTRSVAVAQGLAQVNSAAGTMIAFSTQPDNVAQDGAGRNSPFTAALLKYVATPNLEIEQMMKLVRVDVMTATNEQQVPWGHSSLVGDVYLNPRAN